MSNATPEASVWDDSWLTPERPEDDADANNTPPTGIAAMAKLTVNNTVACTPGQSGSPRNGWEGPEGW